MKLMTLNSSNGATRKNARRLARICDAARASFSDRPSAVIRGPFVVTVDMRGALSLDHARWGGKTRGQIDPPFHDVTA